MFNPNQAEAGVTFQVYVSAKTAHVGEYAMYSFKRYSLALNVLKAARTQGRTSFIIQGE